MATAVDNFDLESFGDESLHAKSHGESVLALVQNRFWGEGLYILDEPEAALSPTRQLTLLREMSLLVQTGSQLIIATHSPILMAYPGVRVLRLDGEGVRAVEIIATPNITPRHAAF